MLALNRDADLLSQLEEQFKVHSANCAVVSEGTSWSYAQLDAASAGCASVLQNGSHDFAPVALLMDHAAPVVAAIVGVLRSGGFYIVLNSAHSTARLAQICDEVRPRAIITDIEHEGIARQLIQSSRQLLLFSDLVTNSATFVKPSPSSSAPCALFYTSGSLKVPKPLVYTYGGTFHNVSNHARSLKVHAHDRLTLLSPCSAAASVSSLFAALLNGSSIHPFQPAREGLSAIGRWIERERLTIYHSVPSLFRRFLRTLDPDQLLASVRTVKLGGEPVFAGDIDLFRQHFRKGAVLINGLGMTEANGNVAHCHITDGIKLDGPVVPIGRPLDGVEIKLLNGDGSEVAPGEIGEIVLRGKHIAPAFWTGRDVKLFSPERDGWFRTGDLGRKNDLGLLEHHGRKDNQLKRRGQWVSLAEIEAALLQIDGVKEVAAVAVEQKDGEDGIAAFLCWKGAAVAEDELRRRLKPKLLAQALPNIFFNVANLPLLPNGKIDRRALSQTAKDSWPKDAEVRSQTFDSITLELLSIWKQVLERGNITIKDDFFDLGGDSLAAVAIIAAVEKIFRLRLPTTTLQAAPTIEKLAKVIRASNGTTRRVQVVGYRLAGKNPALYYVPAAGSEAFELKLLPRHLPVEQPILAFQPKGLDGRARYHASVEEMAKYYLVHLRVHQANGPYYLCGNCFGGVVAFEMAQQLTATGEEVAFLGLFDSYGGDYPKPRSSGTPSPKAVEPLLARLFRWNDEGIKDRNSPKGKLFKIDVALRFSLFARNYESRTACLRRLCKIARRRYRLRPFRGRIDLFRTADVAPAEVYEPDPLLGWGGMARQGIEVHELAGRHGDYMREPEVRVFADLLSACLARARSSAGERMRVKSLPV
jgi:acyl-coenzyme A synthetase/AMP-(fatty) acid ligase/thioesterase domain-containing protein/acyl carrier protein